MILAGDVGGTKCNLALFREVDGRQVSPVVSESFPSKDFESLENVLEAFLDMEEVSDLKNSIKAVCFGIAGPIVNGEAKISNLPWVVRTENIRKKLQLEDVFLINDLVATGYGVCAIPADQFHELYQGTHQGSGHAALIAAGTGLGEALLFRQGDRFIPMPSEGGHSDFAPRTPLEIQLLQYLLQRWDHVSVERALSGPGLMNIYNFLRDSGRESAHPSIQREIEESSDPAAVISKAALEDTCQLCSQALDLFVAIYGAEAGNLALKGTTLGGVYLGGGIAPKILDRLESSTFLDAFFSKGRMESLLRKMSIQVIMEPRAALFGAAYFALLESG